MPFAGTGACGRCGQPVLYSPASAQLIKEGAGLQCDECTSAEDLTDPMVLPETVAEVNLALGTNYTAEELVARLRQAWSQHNRGG